MLGVRVYAVLLITGFLCVYGDSQFDFDEIKYGIYGVSINSEPLLRREVEADWRTTIEVRSYKQSPGLERPLDLQNGLSPTKHVRLSNKNNVEFLCSVPPIDLRKNVTDLLEFLRILSLHLKTVGWWTYELCYGRYARQYHVEGKCSIFYRHYYGKVVEPFMLLGRYASDLDWENAAEVASKFQSSKQTLYHSQIYENGTICDLNNQFRRTEVRFYCDNDFQGAYLYSVDEPVSCQYIFNVHTSTLCQLKMFTPMESKPSPVGIECRPLLDDEQYKAFQGSSRHGKYDDKVRV
ncbi:PRKCSH domain containing protein [Trichuris trichiura]|uniref:PRKCSH domain containing protein n=1 Tax=Trichuris trichiura TaxID=36087 RepID=A0A077Z456_TRITR|nr:PRKCSH domain containing protein [Trichuris trichiura]